MSNAAQAFDHAAFCRGKDREQERFWVERALHEIRTELHLPEHMHTKGGLTCGTCWESADVASVAHAADFRDRHYYCGETTIPSWVCPKCGKDCLGFLPSCGFCWEVRPEQARLFSGLDISTILWQRQNYEILQDELVLATVSCGSLLRARRAARAMFPRQPITVQSPSGVWSALNSKDRIGPC